MAQRFVSPGVFTEERDLSFLPQGIAEIGAAFVGPFEQGPAFRPVIVESNEEFQRTFGGMNPDFYTPYAVQSYLTEASRATCVRVLGLAGYDHSTVKSVVLTVSGGLADTEAVIALIHPSKIGVSFATCSISGTPTNFTLTLSGSSGSTALSGLSIESTSSSYFAKVLGYDPTTKQQGYAYAHFPIAANAYISGAAAGSGSITATLTSTELMLSGSTYGVYSNASTPMIRSQIIGASRLDLFKFWTLSDGVAANKQVKISIASIKPATDADKWGTFSVLVRAFDDTDAKTSVLEQFDNLDLNPESVNFIARRIGTARTVIDANDDIYLEGDWPNNSKYVYVEMDTGFESLPIAALPYGFGPMNPPINSAIVPSPEYVTTRYYTPVGASTAIANNKTYYGLNFDSDTTLSYFAPLPSGSSVKVGLTRFNVGDTGFDLNTVLASTDQDVTGSTATNLRKFTVGFQGGFDGQNPAANRYTGASITSTNTMGFDLSDSNKDGARAYNRAIQALANPDAWDINMLVMPGVIYSQHSYVVTQGINMCEDRGDCFYILDSDVLGATVSTVLNSIDDLDTSYAAVYHPWVKIRDTDSNKVAWVPPSVVLPEVYAFNDRVGAEWYAPAGLNRGGVSRALQVRSRLDLSDRDDLYEGRVNPIALFPNQGIVVWGQKTLQEAASALDRVNVRRLLIAVKKFIASVSRYLVFEQNVASTRNRFLNIVNPYLASVQERNGLYAFKVRMDETNNTADIIDRNILVGDIYLQPAKTAEGIFLNFNILPTGASFEE